MKKLFFCCISLLFFENVYAQDNVIKPSMSQEEINKIISANDSVIVESGDYSYKLKDKDYHKIININKEVSLCGSYTGGLQLISNNDSVIKTTCDTNLTGTADTTGSAAAAIVSLSKELVIQGNINIKNYNNGIRIGYTNSMEDATVSIKNKSKIVIENSNYIDVSNDYDNGYDGVTPSGHSQGCGTSGSGIYVIGKGNNTLNINNSTLFNNNNKNAAIYPIRVNNFSFNLVNSTAYLNNNDQGINMNTDYAEGININLNNSILNVLDNASNGITGQNKNYFIDLKNNSILNVSNNKSIGINNMNIKSNNSKIVSSNNGGHGITNVSFNASKSNIEVSNNKYIGLNILNNSISNKTIIVDSVLNLFNNGGPGLRVYTDNTVFENSQINLKTNGFGTDLYGYSNDHKFDRYSGIVTSNNVDINNTIIMDDSAASLSLTKNKVNVKKSSVIAFNGKYNDTISDSNGRIIIYGGSLQMDTKKASNSLKNYKLNMKIDDEANYALPVNQFNTLLTKFVLHKNINKELNNDLENTFYYTDPNKKNKKIEYTFRYNTDSEDLTKSGNKAYIWTPVSLINYNATEGLINVNKSTSEKINEKVAVDTTIYDNSLDLGEKILPVAELKNYVFDGWYIPSDSKLASQYVKEENYKELYKLLNNKFESSTKILGPELTVYAKYTKKAKLIVKYISDDNKELADTISLIYNQGDEYTTHAKDFKNYKLFKIKGLEHGNMNDDTIVTYIYSKTSIPQTGIKRNKKNYLIIAVVAIILYIVKKKF